jgi:hypothetical protein
MGLDPVTAAIGGGLAIAGNISAQERARRQRKAVREGTATVIQALSEAERVQTEAIGDNIDFISKAFDEAIKENRVTGRETEGIISDFALLSLADATLSQERAQKFFSDFKTSVGEEDVSERFASILEQGAAGEFDSTTERLQPLLNFRRERAQEALDKQLAARRGVSSGAALEAASRLQANLAADEAELVLGEQARLQNIRQSLLRGTGQQLGQVRQTIGTFGTQLGLGREQALAQLRQSRADVLAQTGLARAQTAAGGRIATSQIQAPSLLEALTPTIMQLGGQASGLFQGQAPAQQTPTLPPVGGTLPQLLPPTQQRAALPPFDPRLINQGFQNPFLRGIS